MIRVYSPSGHPLPLHDSRHGCPQRTHTAATALCGLAAGIRMEVSHGRAGPTQPVCGLCSPLERRKEGQTQDPRMYVYMMMYVL